MTKEEKIEEITKRVKEKLDESNIRITSIFSRISENQLLRDGTTKKVLFTRFYEANFNKPMSLISDYDTLKMLYIQAGPMNFAEINEFFQPFEGGD